MHTPHTLIYTYTRPRLLPPTHTPITLTQIHLTQIHHTLTPFAHTHIHTLHTHSHFTPHALDATSTVLAELFGTFVPYSLCTVGCLTPRWLQAQLPTAAPTYTGV